MTSESTMQGLEKTLLFLKKEGLSKERLLSKVAWIRRNYGLSEVEGQRLLVLIDSTK